MKEVTETVDLTGAAELYPGACKVTVDMPNRTAYVFVGQSNRALTVTGDEFDKLVKVIPAKAGAGDVEPAEPAEPTKPAAQGKGKQ